MARPSDRNVSPKLRKQILEDAENVCHYCESEWAGVVDHVRPVSQDGALALGNLVAACDRCNSEKSGMTPAKWKSWRLERGRPWPPSNGINVLWELISVIGYPEVRRLDRAFKAGDWRVRDAISAVLDLDHKGRFGSFHAADFDLDSLRSALVEHATEVMGQVALFEAELVA